MSTTLHPKVAVWMARIADALEEIGDCNPGWGDFHISEVVVSFDGDESGYRIRPDDGGGFELVVT